MRLAITVFSLFACGASVTAAVSNENQNAFLDALTSSASLLHRGAASIRASTNTSTDALDPACYNETFVPNASPLRLQVHEAGVANGTRVTSADDATLRLASTGLVAEWSARALPDATFSRFEYTSLASGSTLVHPAFDEVDCTAAYDGSLTPAVAAATTGPKNILFLIDVSSLAGFENEERLEMAKAAMLALVELLSVQDYLAIVPFSDMATNSITGFVPATSTNVRDVILPAILRLTVAATPKNSRLGDALKTARGLLASARETVEGAMCTDVVVVFASGRNDELDIDSAEGEAASRSDWSIFTHYLVPASMDLTTSEWIRLKRIACTANGVAAVARTAAEAAANVLNVVSVLQELNANTDQVRYVEQFDYVAGRPTVTGVMSLYEDGKPFGVLAVEMTGNASSTNGSLTASEIVGLLQSSMQCTRLDWSSAASQAVLARTRGDQCDNIDAVADRNLWAVTNKSVLIFLSVLLFALLLAIPFSIRLCRQTPMSKLFLVCLAAILVSWCTGLGLFWGVVFDDAIAARNFVPVSFVVERQIPMPYRCCAPVECFCTDVERKLCPVLVNAGVEGLCTNEYKCCINQCRQCCTNTSAGYACSECCGCGQAALNQGCYVRCGTCHHVSVEVSYEYEGKPISARIEEFCPVNDTACVDTFLRNHPVGEVHRAYANPEDPRALQPEADLRPSYVVPCVVLLLFGVLPFVVSCYLAYFGSVDLPDPNRRRAYVNVESSGAANRPAEK
jgi:ABC-type sugar transport system permease subunit